MLRSSRERDFHDHLVELKNTGVSQTLTSFYRPLPGRAGQTGAVAAGEIMGDMSLGAILVQVRNLAQSMQVAFMQVPSASCCPCKA